MLQEYPGYAGMFSRDQAAGAIPNGTRISKVLSEIGDAHEIGELGTVLGSMPMAGLGFDGDFFYWIEWDNMPKVVVGVTDKKIAKWIG